MTIRILSLVAAICAFGFFTACGDKKAKPVEQGPRITSVYLSSGYNPNNTWGAGFTNVNLDLTVVNGDHTLTFNLQPTANGSTSQPQMRGNIEYTMQSMCVDQYCDRIAFLLVMRSFDYNSPGWNQTPRTGYGSNSNQYVAGQSAKAYLFREVAANGQLEQVRVVTGNYYNVNDALRDLGAYY